MPPIDRFTDKAKEAIRIAHELAIERGKNHVGVLHMLLALSLQDGGMVPAILEKLNVDVEDFTTSIMVELDDMASKTKPDVLQSSMQLFISQELAKIIELSMKIAGDMKNEYIGTEHLFLGFFQNKNEASQLLQDFKIKKTAVANVIKELQEAEKLGKKKPKQFLKGKIFYY